MDRPWKLACALSLVAAGLAPGCRAIRALDVISIPEAKDWNLEQLHTPGDEHRYTATLLGDVSYLLRRLVSGMGPGKGLDAMKRDPKNVGDPGKRCLENLLELAAFSPADEGVAILQVEWAARLAVRDPWVLSRERATFMLGAAGERLGIEAPRGLPEGAQPIGPAGLAEVLARLVRSFREEIVAGRPAAGGARQLAELCQEVAELTLDLDGGRRALRATRALLAAGGTHPGVAPVRELSLELQRRLVDLALAGALADAEPRVRAAALVATVEAVGPRVVARILADLEREHAEEVLVQAFRLVADHGLPAPSQELDGEAYEQARERWLSLLHFHAVNHNEGTVRINAMQALARVSEAGIASLREEDWHRWWQLRGAAGEAPPAIGNRGDPGG